MTGRIGAADLRAGTVYPFGEYRLTLEEVLDFAVQWDPQDFHTDVAAADAGAYGGIIASGIQTLAVLQRLTVLGVYRDWQVVAGRSMRDVHFLRPVRPGDVLTGWARIDDVIADGRGRADVVVSTELTVGDRPVLRAVTDVVVRY